MPCLGYLTCIPDKLMRRWHKLPPAELSDFVLDDCWEHNTSPEGTRFELQLWWDDLDRVFGGSLSPVSDHSGPNYPFSHIIFGGRPLSGEDHIKILKPPEEVAAVAAALEQLTRETFLEEYFQPHEFDLYEDEDLLWDLIRDMVPFWTGAAERGDWVLFDAAQ